MRSIGVVALLVVIGCGQAPASERLGETDAGVLQDAGADGGDAGVDGGPDGGDAGVDGGPDAGVDGGTAPRWPPQRIGYVNPIPGENLLPGDADWMRGVSTSWNHQIEGYTDRVSALAGDTVQVMMTSDAPHAAAWALYRLGWYGGAGARKVMDGGAIQIGPQGACPHTSTGLIRCQWPATFTVTIPHDAVSGLYLVRVVRGDRYATFLPLVVRDDRAADVLFQAGVSTYQAYNPWGGESLYQDDFDHVPGGFALSVSFDRPYGRFGDGQMLRYEQRMARFLERNGYDVTYTSSLDVSREGAGALTKRGAWFYVGHDEYWSGELRDAIEGARDSGVPELWFGGNPAYWKVRYTDPGPDGNARVITVYKMNPAADPLAGTSQRTGRWRDPPIDRPEEQLLGVMYESWMLFGQPWVVRNSSHPFYAGTGLGDGDSVPMLTGYEYDRTFANDTPGEATLLAHSPLVDAEGRPSFQESTIFTAPSGALVFAAGTIYWSLFVDGPQRDPRVERMTANLLQLALGLPVPASLQTLAVPPVVQPDPTWATDVRTLATGIPGPAGIARLPGGTFVVADARAHRIWSVNEAGAVTPFAGDGNESGSTRYDNVPALQARFFQPTSVLADAIGNVYVADTHNCVIRKVANDAVRTVTSLAGVFQSCRFADGAGSNARFYDPMGMAWQDATHILVADSANQAIRVLDVTNGAVSTLAGGNYGDEADGPGKQAIFFFPTAVAAAADGRVFFVASSKGEVKVIGTDASRTVTTLIRGAIGFADGVSPPAALGFADGTGATALMLAQGGLVWDGAALLVADVGNKRIRRVVPGRDAASTRVQTWAGSGRVGELDGPACAASFTLPLGLFRDSDGTVYVSDGGGTVRVIRP
jgi:hypothetical protein